MICPVQYFKELSIQEYGNIKVCEDGTIIGKKGKLKPSYNNSKKYGRVHIGKHMYPVHRLVAMAWIPNPENKPQVNHKNGIKTDNYPDNLEWVTNRENRIHAVKNNLSSATLSFEQIDEIRELYSTGNYTYCDLANLYGVSYSNIGYIIRKDSWNY